MNALYYFIIINILMFLYTAQFVLLILIKFSLIISVGLKYNTWSVNPLSLNIYIYIYIYIYSL